MLYSVATIVLLMYDYVLSGSCYSIIIIHLVQLQHICLNYMYPLLLGIFRF